MLRCCHHGKAIARVHPVRLMNADSATVAANPQTKQTDLGCESAYGLLSSTPTIAIYFIPTTLVD